MRVSLPRMLFRTLDDLRLFTFRVFETNGMRTNKRFARYAWAVLAYNLIVILWGAFVRATGSGAGCGSHWPLCNGEVVPKAPEVETLIELTHRLTSGLAGVFVVILFIWAFRAFRKGHPVRRGATLSLIFIITEGLVGAGLVLFEWVADDASLGRVFSMAVHLVNTMLLLASLTLTVWWAAGGPDVHLRRRGEARWLLGFALLGMLVLSTAGALTALGDTLFRADTLAEGFRQDFSSAAHFLERLRIGHPLLAVLFGAYLLFVTRHLRALRPSPAVKHFSRIAVTLFVAQFLGGLLNVFLLAPVWMQLVHLLLADFLWISLVLLGASGLAVTTAEPVPGGLHPQPSG